MIRILSSLVAFFSITTLFAQVPSGEIPKLVVGITIDQLRGDYLEMFRHRFGNKGFNRLLNNGLVYSNIHYDFPNLNKASSITTIFTGANPSYHGIMSENRYSIESNREISSFYDDNYLGNFTTEKLSPLSIKVSTIADELKIASAGQSDIFAFAPDASQAFASGGHAASGAFWIEDENGKWATSTFYKSRQPIIDQHNRSGQSLTHTIHTLSWRPAIDVNRYDAFPYTRSKYNFQHFFVTEKNGNIRLFKQSPFLNKEVNDMAVRMLESGSLGKRINPDFLALTFYAGNYEKAVDNNYSVEIQDTYYRLDQELERLLDAIDSAVGLKNTLIFVVSTGYFNEQEVIPEEMVTSGGDFYPERSQALLNMYLMVLYGREQWIKKYWDRQFFFDRKLLEDRQIDLKEFQQKAAEFLVQSAGIQDVITSHQMLHGAYNQDMQYYRNGFFKGQSGDLFLRIQPGWRIVDPQSDQNIKVRNNAIMAPVIFFGSDIKPQIIDRTIKATEIAPSVAYRLRIRAPNAAQDEILKEFLR
ncbi:MAG: alkaline phosphatase family protein [Bacteroidales bacterium]|nr:alkaline phosphatase family protein [Bacteroidales bacterium]